MDNISSEIFYLALTAWCTAIIAVAAIITSVFQHLSTKRANGAEIFFKLEEQFYHTERFRSLRRKAAEELLRVEQGDENGEKLPHFGELADFFEFVGVLLEQDAVNSEMIWNSFYRRAYSYFRLADKHNLIAKHRNMRPSRWISYDSMLGRLNKIQVKLSRHNISDDEVIYVLKTERDIPTAA